MRRVVLILLASLTLAACERKPAAKVTDLAEPPAADRRISWFEETEHAWVWVLADAATGATIRTPLDTVTLGLPSYGANGRFAVFLTRGGIRDSSNIVDQKVFVADLEAKRLWEFLAPEDYILTAGVDDAGPYFVGSSFREDPGATRAFVARVLGTPEPCKPAVATVQRFDAGKWHVAQERTADCHDAVGPTSTLLAEYIAQPERSRPQSQRPESLLRELEPEAGDGQWSFLLEKDGSGLALLGASGFATTLVAAQRIRPVLPGMRLAPATSLDGATSSVDRAGGWMLVSYGRTDAESPDGIELGIAAFDMAAGKETMRVREGIHFPELWVAPRSP